MGDTVIKQLEQGHDRGATIQRIREMMVGVSVQ